jgi:hypothetical protein
LDKNQKTVKRVIVSLAAVLSFSTLYFISSWWFSNGDKSSQEATSGNNNVAASVAVQQTVDDPRFNQLIISIENISNKIDSINARQDEFALALDKLGNRTDEASDEDVPVVRYDYTKPERQAILESSMSNNNSDDPWVSSATAIIENLFVSVPAISIAKNRNVICSNELCKVSFRLPKSLSYSQKTLLQMQLLNDVAPILTRANYFTERMADGSDMETYYMARDGFKLPTETLAPTTSEE